MHFRSFDATISTNPILFLCDAHIKMCMLNSEKINTLSVAKLGTLKMMSFWMWLSSETKTKSHQTSYENSYLTLTPFAISRNLLPTEIQLFSAHSCDTRTEVQRNGTAEPRLYVPLLTVTSVNRNTFPWLFHCHLLNDYAENNVFYIVKIKEKNWNLIIRTYSWTET